MKRVIAPGGAGPGIAGAQDNGFQPAWTQPFSAALAASSGVSPS